MKEYKALENQHAFDLRHLSKKYNLISAVRLLFAIAFAFNLYYYSQPNNAFLIIPLIVIGVAFLLAVRVHQRISWKKLLKNALVKINSDEVAFLGGKEIPFENGIEFIDTTHSYSYDLDFFGEHSFYHNLNRAATKMGSGSLATRLLSFLSNQEIAVTQQAIKELDPNVEWRQEVLALATINSDSSESYADLMQWAKRENKKLSPLAIFVSYLLPALLIPSIVLYFATPMAVFGNISLLLFVINLFVLGLHKNRISDEIAGSTETDKILRQYSHILEKIETENFESLKLQQLQRQLLIKETTASSRIAELSSLFGKMDHVQNAFASPLLNGLFLFHIHTLKALDNWRSEWSDHISDWLEVIGEIEALNSLANFSHNNPEYTYPALNDDQQITFKDLGHPLIDSQIRINNDVSFNPQNFFILTGSNMSGKSTFLRTLGINMVLTSIGAPICAREANVHPLPVLVSMRLSDSLNDSESYFFAEVKRLKEIMDGLDSALSFVLLDEILRGTNSDDKRSGTIEVIKKMVKKNAIGAIATHDLEVCNTSNEYPDKLANKNFEVEIVNDELVFDYKLRDGICKNKSATFLMKKMDVI
ncbi:MAG: DNA mismatch repair protein [Cyclobacteriaceae bacterium]